MKPRADYRKGLAHVGQMPALAKTTADIAKDCLKRPKTTQAAKLNSAARTADRPEPFLVSIESKRNSGFSV
jgi:hypothetical protein